MYSARYNIKREYVSNAYFAYTDASSLIKYLIDYTVHFSMTLRPIACVYREHNTSGSKRNNASIFYLLHYKRNTCEIYT